MFFLKNENNSESQKSFSFDPAGKPAPRGKKLYLAAFVLFTALTFATLMIGFADGFTSERTTVLMLNGWFAVCMGEILRRIEEAENQAAATQASQNGLQEAMKELTAERGAVPAQSASQTAEVSDENPQAFETEKNNSGKAA